MCGRFAALALVVSGVLRVSLPLSADGLDQSSVEGRQAAASAVATPLETVATVAFLGSATAAPDGDVYFSEIIGQRIHRLAPDGTVSVFRERSNVANGLLIDAQGRLLACEGGAFERPGFKIAGTPRVTRTNLATGAIEVLAERYDGTPFVSPNDMTIDRAGRIYFTDRLGDAVFRIGLDGTVTRVLDSRDVDRPNGLQLSPDDRTLYVGQTSPGNGARAIYAFDVRDDGTAGRRRVLYNFYPGRAADGFSVDVDGNLYLAAGINQPRPFTTETLDTKTGVYVISPKGELRRFIPIPEDEITDASFGGPDMKTLFVTAGKNLYRLRTDIPGLPR